MIKNIFFTAIIFVSLGTVQRVQAQKAKPVATKTDVKFLENISVEITPTETKSDPKAIFKDVQFQSKKEPVATPVSNPVSVIENASSLQLKYAILLDMEVE